MAPVVGEAYLMLQDKPVADRCGSARRARERTQHVTEMPSVTQLAFSREEFESVRAHASMRVLEGLAAVQQLLPRVLHADDEVTVKVHWHRAASWRVGRSLERHTEEKSGVFGVDAVNCHELVPGVTPVVLLGISISIDSWGI